MLCFVRNPGLFWLCVASLCDWSRKFVLVSQAFTLTTKTNRYARVLLRLKHFVCCYFEFFGALCDLLLLCV